MPGPCRIASNQVGMITKLIHTDALLGTLCRQAINAALLKARRDEVVLLANPMHQRNRCVGSRSVGHPSVSPDLGVGTIAIC